MPDTTMSRQPPGTGAGTEAPQDEPLGAVLRRELGQIVLVLQGGGALGAYQVGVYQALHEAGIEPDWVIGTSIGAINASLIAGNAPEHRMPRLLEFWRRVEHGGMQQALGWLPMLGPASATWMTVLSGVAGFFTPNPWAFGGVHMPLGAQSAGYYHTTPLRETLGGLVDFARINQGGCRLTVGAANVRTSEMHYFDSRDQAICLDHVLASGALPPAFPAVRIDGELYWDGGILSNTPVEAIFDDKPRRNGLVFVVHIWNPEGAEPNTIWEVMNRQKDIQYSSRTLSHIQRQQQLHRLRHVIAELAKALPEGARDRPEIRELAAYGCTTQMHVVRLVAPKVEGEDHTKDIDFSPGGIRTRRQAGYQHAKRVIALAPWCAPADKIEGFILHEAPADDVLAGR
jgi:NTE family protein